jgi:hypothetical protein
MGLLYAPLICVKGIYGLSYPSAAMLGGCMHKNCCVLGCWGFPVQAGRKVRNASNVSYTARFPVVSVFSARIHSDWA